MFFENCYSDLANREKYTIKYCMSFKELNVF